MSIVSARVSGKGVQRFALVEWSDGSATHGPASSTHMKALIARARRERVLKKNPHPRGRLKRRVEPGFWPKMWRSLSRHPHAIGRTWYPRRTKVCKYAGPANMYELRKYTPPKRKRRTRRSR